MAEILIAAAIAAAISAASYTISYLLQPKQKPVERGRLQGEIQVQDSSYGQMIPLVYGGAMPDGSAHGFRLAGNVIYLSEIRKTRTERTERSGTGKGARETQIVDHTYDADVAVMFTDNEAELLALYADADVLYDVRPSLFGPSGPGVYEAESAALTNASVFSDSRFSNGSGAKLEEGTGAAQWANVQGYGASTLVRLTYFTSGRRQVTIYVNGSSAWSGWLPPGQPAGATAAVTQFALTLDVPYSGTNTLKVVNTLPDAGAELWLDKVDVIQPSAPSGGVNPTPTVPGDIDPAVPPDPHPGGGPDDYGRHALNNYSYIAPPDEDGTVNTSIVGGQYSNVRWYSGTETQQPDPLIEAYFQGLYPTEYGLGLDVAPAYLGRSYVVLERFDLSNYQRIPNFTAILRNPTIRTARQILDDLAARSRALPEDYDFTSLDALYVRGLAMVNRSTLKQFAADTLQVRWGFDFAQRDGAVSAVLRGGAAGYTVPSAHLGFKKPGGKGGEGAERVRVSIKLSESELPRQVDVTAYNPAKEHEAVSRSWRRSLVGSAAAQAVAVEMALLPEEVTDVARRLGETAWTEQRYAVDFSLPHQYLVMQPSEVAEVDDGQGQVYTCRVVERTGAIPGVLDFKAVLTAPAQYYEPVIPATGFEPPAPPVPPLLVGQFLETDYLSAAEEALGAPGFYVAVGSYEQGVFRGAAVYQWRGGVRVHVLDLEKQAVVGVCAGALAATDTGAEYVDADLYGAIEPGESYTDADLAAGKGWLMVGAERLQYKTATKQAGHTNRWRFSDLRSRASNLTARSGHAAGERLMVLDSAVKFLPLTPEDAGVPFDYQFVAAGMSPDDVPNVSFTWSGDGYLPRPSNLKLQRLSASTGAALTVSFDKGRRGGSLGVATGREVYRVRIIDVTSGDVVREHYLTANYNEAVQFVSTFDPGSLLTIGENGTVETAGSSSQVGTALSSQVLYGDARVVLRLGAKRPPAVIELVGAGVACGRDTATDEVTAPDHYFSDGDQVVFVGAGGSLSGSYYVVGATSDRYQIAATAGGAPVSLAGTNASFTMYYPSPIPSPGVCGLIAATDTSSSPVELRPTSAAIGGALAVADDLVVLELNNGVINFYVGNLNIPFYTSAVQPSRHPVQVKVTVGQSAFVLDTGGAHAQGIYRSTIQHSAARSFLYASAMQANDASSFTGGVVPATVKVEVCEMFDGEPGLAASAIG